MSVPTEVPHVDRVIKRFGAPIKQAYVHRAVIPLPEHERRLVDLQVESNGDLSRRFAVGSWVKISSGLYAGDVGKVYHSTSTSDDIQVLVAPRLPQDPSQYYRHPRKGYPQIRPSPTLCVLDNVPNGDLEPGPVPHSFRVGDEVYLTNGLQLLTVQGLHYARPMQRPSAEDVWLFTVAGCDTVLETNRSFLGSGDSVEIIRGVAQNVLGIVLRVDGESVEVEVGEDSSMCANMSDVRRIFSPGDSVAVRLGPHKGDSGLVCAVQDVRVDGVQHTEVTILLGSGHDQVRYAY